MTPLSFPPTIHPMSTRTIPVSEFTAHPDADLALVEHGDLTIELTRDGKVIAIITPPRTRTDRHHRRLDR